MPDMRGVLKRFYPVILLVLLVSVSVDLLSLVNEFTGPVVAEQEKALVLAQFEDMFPDMTEFTIEDDIYILMADDNIIGYAFLAEGFGAWGRIKILVALENETTVKGIFIVSHTETPGLGSRITEPAFTDQFAGMKIEDIKLTAKAGQIDAITGATISSTSVIEIVRNTAMEKVKALPEP